MGVPGSMKTDREDKKRTLDTKGFTLVEVLIAIVILAIGLLAVASLQVSAIHGNAFGNEVTQATFLGQDKLEDLKNSADITTEANGNDTVGIFSRSWQIAAATGNGRLVTVTVGWTQRQHDHSVVLSTVTRGNGE